MSVPTDAQLGRFVPENVALSVGLQTYRNKQRAPAVSFARFWGSSAYVSEIDRWLASASKKDVQECQREDVDGVVLKSMRCGASVSRTFRELGIHLYELGSRTQAASGNWPRHHC